MSTLGPSSYHFNATFVGDRQLGPTEVRPCAPGWPWDSGWPWGGRKALKWHQDGWGLPGGRGGPTLWLKPGDGGVPVPPADPPRSVPRPFPRWLGTWTTAAASTPKCCTSWLSASAPKPSSRWGQAGDDPRVGGGMPGHLRHPQLVAGTVAGPATVPVPLQTHQAKFVTWQFDGEYRGDDCTATLTLGNPDLLGESVILVAHFLQSVTSRLVLGGEMVYHRRPGEEGAILTLAGKYTALKWVATLNVGYGGAHASYYHRANEQVQVGVELEANTRLQDTTFAFGYQLNLPQANMVFRGLLDSNWSVGGVLEKKLPPLPVTLALGAFLNHWKNRFHCGFSVIVG
uniref:Translocase of outer mitochondrial membrane 40 like n=1 Tax=Aquila chrysaetos chrysaetos TaxID=223781 RepID=A0A663ELK2_AQUCH